MEFWRLQDAIEPLYQKYKEGDEIPAVTLRRVIVSGEVTRNDFCRIRGFGPRGYAFVLYLCGLTEEVKVEPR